MLFRSLAALAFSISLGFLSSVSHAASPTNEERQNAAQQQNALSAIYTMRSQCDNTAWVLWHSNDYKDWRKTHSMLSMNYSYSIPEKLPPAPPTMSADIKSRYEKTVGDAIATVSSAGPVFRDLATYINAKDYEDDKFTKGDALNAQLLTFGETCHGLTKDLEQLYADYSAAIFEAALADPAKAERAAQLKEDIVQTQALAKELSKGVKADRPTVEAMVADISKKVDARKALLPAQGSDSDPLKRFYLADMEDDIAVELRKMLRESKNNPKVWAEKLGDRPRSMMMQIRNTALIQMPNNALAAVQ